MMNDTDEKEEPMILPMPGTIGSAKLVFPPDGLETLDLLDKIDMITEPR